MSIEFILHGSGTSSSVPNISCLTSSTLPRCPTCWSATLPSGRKNYRRNTGALLRIWNSCAQETPSSFSRRDGEAAAETDVIVIDAGKTFLASTQEWFPRYGLRRIAAVVLTHAHADAMNGLDDLRGWTLHGQVQDSINVYLTRDTFSAIHQAFPYLISKEHATGGGDVSDLRYHFIENGVPFTVNGITITPLEVEHGRSFSVPAPKAPPFATQSRVASFPTPPETPIRPPGDLGTTNTVPYMAVGFLFDSLLPVPSASQNYLSGASFELTPTRIAYFSDVSRIPDTVWELIEKPMPGTYQVPPALVIMDCLRPRPYSSHFGLAQAYTASRRLIHPPPTPTSIISPSGALPKDGKAYMVGFSHEFTMAEWKCIGDVLQGLRSPLEFRTPTIDPSYPVKRTATSGVGRNSTEFDDNWRLPDGGVRPPYVWRALQELREVVPSLDRLMGSQFKTDDGADEAQLGFVDENERIHLQPAWDGIRLFVRGALLFEDDPSGVSVDSSAS